MKKNHNNNWAEKNNIQWTPIIELVILLVTTLGTTIPLYIHTDAKLASYQEKTQVLVESIREDMRDFHGRLERQDAEFKGKMALQDQEFKNKLCEIEERSKK